MTKRDLILKVSDSTGIRQNLVREVVQKTFDVMLQAMLNGEKIEIRNFGIFKTKVRKPRVGRNPKTGQVVQVPERRVVVFKLGQKVKENLQ